MDKGLDAQVRCTGDGEGKRRERVTHLGSKTCEVYAAARRRTIAAAGACVVGVSCKPLSPARGRHASAMFWGCVMPCPSTGRSMEAGRGDGCAASGPTALLSGGSGRCERRHAHSFAGVRGGSVRFPHAFLQREKIPTQVHPGFSGDGVATVHAAAAQDSAIQCNSVHWFTGYAGTRHASHRTAHMSHPAPCFYPVSGDEVSTPAFSSTPHAACDEPWHRSRG